MNLKKENIIKYVILPIILFAWAYLLRRYFFCGFILGDDPYEVSTVLHVMSHGPIYYEQFHLRFGVWLFNVIFFKLFGVSETIYFMPTLIMSSSLCVIGYFILIRGEWAVGSWQLAKKPNPQFPNPDPVFPIPNSPFLAFLAGLFVASAPFEVFIGVVRANDLILSWLLAMGFMCLIIFEKRPLLQGILVAFFLWLGFYVKLFAVYLLPALGFYYLFQFIRNRKWGGFVWFSITFLLLHGLIGIFWQIKAGHFFPWLTIHAPTTPIEAKDLGLIFMQYPNMILKGSDLGTTFFGYVPYFLLVLLMVKLVLLVIPQMSSDCLKWDRFDIYLLVYYGSFFIFVNFFNHSFKFDHYYTAPRIFRYITPLSFPMSLHAAKLALDFVRAAKILWTGKTVFYSIIFSLLIIANIYHANNATMPGRIYSRALTSILRDIKESPPPQLLVESWLRFLLQAVYFKIDMNKVFIVPSENVYSVHEYEKWLKEIQFTLPNGAMLITGLGGYVYYGAINDGFRLTKFEGNLDPRWKLFKEYEMKSSFQPFLEPARLWILSDLTDTSWIGDLPSHKDLPEIISPDNLFKKGINYFDSNNYVEAKSYFKMIVDDFPDAVIVDNARYFYAICFYRERDWNTTIDEFKGLMDDYPDSNWIAAAHYHIGLCYRALHDKETARKEFNYVIKHFPADTHLVNHSKKMIERLRR